MVRLAAVALEEECGVDDGYDDDDIESVGCLRELGATPPAGWLLLLMSYHCYYVLLMLVCCC